VKKGRITSHKDYVEAGRYDIDKWAMKIMDSTGKVYKTLEFDVG
jgi:hypothetical protein